MDEDDVLKQGRRLVGDDRVEDVVDSVREAMARLPKAEVLVIVWDRRTDMAEVFGTGTIDRGVFMAQAASHLLMERWASDEDDEAEED